MVVDMFVNSKLVTGVDVQVLRSLPSKTPVPGAIPIVGSGSAKISTLSVWQSVPFSNNETVNKPAEGKVWNAVIPVMSMVPLLSTSQPYVLPD